MLRFVPITLLLLLPLASQARRWDTLTDCRLNSHPGNDGDSFHVRHAGKDYLFRLYFVDCPETDTSLDERIEEQEAAWRRDRQHLLRAGKEAARFTRERLARPFTVHTRWQDAKGSSDQKRFFAFVEYEPGKFLDEALVAAGHARVYGASESRPDGRSVQEVWSRLERLQRQAETRKVEAWSVSDANDSAPPRPLAPSAGPAGKKPGTLVVDQRVDLFSAQNPSRQIGALRPGATVELVGTPDLAGGLVRIRFSTGDGAEHEALANAHQLGLTPNPFLPR